MIGALLLALTSASGQASQPAQTPGDFAQSLKWDEKTQGPLLYLPHRWLQVPDSSQLEGGFRTTACGTIHVIAPAQMTVIDPDYNQSPNLYDGLPRQIKVLYLASTFSGSQWKTACGEGIGLGDLDARQQAVYRSILPSVFKFRTSPVSNPHDPSPAPGQSTETTLTGDQVSQVRLKVFKEMTLGVRMQDGGFSAAGGQSWDRHKKGQMLSFREREAADEDKNFAYGVEVRKSFPNKSKPSDLQYQSSALDMPCPLSPSTTVKELCQTASGLFGHTILADDRFQDLQVTTLGGSARCGDVLRGLALCLTGTYRKVGNTYVLTSDLEGVGTTMTKLAFWHWNVSQIAEKEADKLKQQISQAAGIHYIDYQRDDPLRPNEAMRAFMDTDVGQGEKTMPASQLSPEWSQILNSKDLHCFSPLRTDVAEPWDTVFWAFSIPGAAPFGWEDELCDMNEFTRYAQRHPNPTPPEKTPTVDLGSLPSSALVVAVQDPAFASKLPQLAKDKGFKEVWLQTTQAQVLSAAESAAKSQGIAVRFVAEPFTAPNGSVKSRLDLDILGDTYSQAESLVNGSEWVKEESQWWPVKSRQVDFFGENGAALPNYWKQLADLANTAGLAGSVVLSPTPVGYEKQSEWPEYEVPEIGAPLMLGYTTDLREKFLLANSVDPVDLLEVRYQLGSLDQSISSFGGLSNYKYGKVQDGNGFRDKWDLMRWDSNGLRLQAFRAIFKTPFLIEWRRRLHDVSRNWDGVVSPPTEDAPAPMLEDDPSNASLSPQAFYLKAVGYPLSDGASSRLRRGMAQRIVKHPGNFAVDVRSVPEDQLEATLKLLFTSH